MIVRSIRLQLKRALGTTAHVLAVTLFLALCVALLGLVLLDRGSDARERVRIGVTGDTEDRYVRLGLELLGELDSSRYAVSFEAMDEAEARRGALSGALVGYLRIPEGFVDSMMRGERSPMTFVYGGVGGVGAMLTGELANAVTELLLETENAIYGVQRYTWERAPDSDWYGESMALFDRYVGAVLDRAELFEVELLGVSHNLTLTGSFFCGLMIFLLMLWCIGAAPFFTRRSAALGELLRSRGVGAPGQVLAEYLAFLALMLAGAAALALLGALALRLLGNPVPELVGRGVFGSIGIFLRALPALLPLSAVAFFLYELFPGAVSGCLAQFLSALAQGFAAGCFYPAPFLPRALSAFGDLLPAGAALRCLAAPVSETADPVGLLAALLWTAALLALSALLRRTRWEAVR